MKSHYRFHSVIKFVLTKNLLIGTLPNWHFLTTGYQFECHHLIASGLLIRQHLKYLFTKKCTRREKILIFRPVVKPNCKVVKSSVKFVTLATKTIGVYFDEFTYFKYLVLKSTIKMLTFRLSTWSSASKLDGPNLCLHIVNSYMGMWETSKYRKQLIQL